LDLASLHVRGNLVPAVAGRLVAKEFLIGPGDGAVPSPDQDPPWAVERLGADGAVSFLFSLVDTDTDGLVHRGQASAPGDPRGATPEVQLAQLTGAADPEPWEWRRSMLAPASQAFDTHFTLDDGTWRRVVGYQRLGGEFVHVDYADDAGATIRFGDGVFGRVPERDSHFRASYLVGNGRQANLPAGAITRFDDASTAAQALIGAIENPLAVDNGVDPETAEEVRQLAPEAFRAVAYRAVRPEDYAEAAERLDWVQRAGCTFRWTGSWQTAFVTPDPRSSVELTEVERGQLERQLDRFRQAGRETHALAPSYADIDLRITFCVAPDAYPSEVKVRVAAALSGTRTAFFSPDHFTFGTPLDRSRLEAAIQAVEGVRAVETISFRRRGFFDWQTLPPTSFRPGRNEVVRVENDPLHPDRGSIQLFTEGGA
jgi:predicted phage baseplate assembly protein